MKANDWVAFSLSFPLILATYLRSMLIQMGLILVMPTATGPSAECALPLSGQAFLSPSLGHVIQPDDGTSPPTKDGSSWFLTVDVPSHHHGTRSSSRVRV